MNCQQCGVNSANFHYQANINGQIIQLNLCEACAHELQGAVFAGGALRLGGLSGTLFGERHRAGRSILPTADQIVPEPSEAKIPLEADATLKQRRVLGALRAELSSEIEMENFERAAELRDEIHRLEQAV